ncbi:hypothetical protein JRO89_XS05G0155000 [Xanthoceras sorbifolium]|uniref:RRM domain-containing protein n=1 Tax=Xanthoceras sorbifolium TaxID=99658 RepID=A0ABQ8I220_9ROSI|nr:hypothetical protein JRO89_XS05G0155000 [Xanthoceras sorbifolium]
MGSMDDQTFKANFTVDGVSKLRERVKDKLKEFMGDYTDDTLVGIGNGALVIGYSSCLLNVRCMSQGIGNGALVIGYSSSLLNEYVIVLLRNGRRKEEARNELNVFLGDDSDSFVSWLWDHLASNLNLYVHPEGSHSNEAAKVKPTSGDKSGSNDSPHLDSETEGGKSNKLSRSRHNREWKGLVRDAAEPQPLRSSEVDDIHFEEKTHREVERGRRSPSPPRPKGQKKRSRTDERQHSKREVGQKTIDAPRRLLQFAVRDAVGTTRPSSSGKEPSLKRLRSVVSTSTGTSELVERPRRIRSVATVPNPLATVIKAVAEAAEDVTRVKSGGNVFDRLGCGMNMTGIADGPAEFREGAVEDEEYENFNQIQEQTGPAYLDRHEYRGQYDGDMTMLDSATVLPFDSMSDNEGYEDVSVTGRKVTDVSQSRLSVGNKGEDSRVQYSIAKNADDIMQISRNKDQHQPVAPMSSSRKVVNISVNVNTWKPPHYQETRDVTALNSRISNQDGDAHAEKSAVQLMKENSNPTTVGNGNVRYSNFGAADCEQAKPAADTQMESQKSLLSAPGLYTTAGRPSEDADSRTIFVSNVHFAATKDSLSRHFNKFGEVLKVVIVTDAATGQPKGSAYVEFMRKEAADNALTLDGTSFMSRILKVLKRNAAHQDAAPLMAWPRIARGSPYAAARFTRAPFPRGLQGAFRPRLPIKPGARSLQWKRDAQATPADSIAQFPGNTIPSPTARSLTYVRSEPKTDGNPGGT